MTAVCELLAAAKEQKRRGWEYLPVRCEVLIDALEAQAREIALMDAAYNKEISRRVDLESRLAAAERDAERYRWLRGDAGPQSVRWPRWSIQHWTGYWNPVQGEGMDAAIDAAREGK